MKIATQDVIAPKARNVSQPVVGLLLLYLLLALIYGMVTPIFEAPDEDGHFRYVQSIAQTRAIPRYPGTDNLIAQQHPPLYYALGAMLIAPIDTSDLPTYLTRNPYGRIGHSDNLGNKNLFLHPPRPETRFPWQGTALAAHLLRWLSSAFGAGTVLLTYATAQRVFPIEKWPPLLAAGLVAFNPQFIFISASINNDNAVTFFATLALFLAVLLTEGDFSWRIAALAGAVAGLATLSKLSGMVTVSIVGLGVVVGWRRHRSWRQLMSQLALVGLAWGVVAGWWLIRNQQLYGDMWGVSEFQRLTGPATPLPLAEYLSMLRGAEISFWAAFGWLNILVAEPIYWFYKVILRAGVLGLLIGGIRYGVTGWRPMIRWRGVCVGLAWVLTFLGSLYWLAAAMGGLQGRLLFPAMGGLALAITVGWHALLPAPGRGWLTAILLLVLATLATAMPFTVLRPAFAPPPVVAADAIPAAARFDPPLVYGQRVELLGVTLSPQAIAPGGTLTVTAYWRMLAPVDDNFSLAVRLYGANRILLGQTDTYPGLGNLPTSQWQTDQIYADTVPVNIAWDAPAPSVAYLSIEWYKFGIQGFSVSPMLDDELFTVPLRVIEIQHEQEYNDP
jgi:4-amino-4-deoxy-L-arabinose transferase-like glycosyltransferase